MLPARRALLSVFDKTGLEELARGLARLGIEIVSTGGTLKSLRGEGHPGHRRVRTSPASPRSSTAGSRRSTRSIHGGILADRARTRPPGRRSRSTASSRIDLVVVNLYPFRETVARGASFEETVEMIDIGGPAMVRAAAKNFGGVARGGRSRRTTRRVLAALEAGGGVVPEALRRRLAVKAFAPHREPTTRPIAGWLGRAGRRSGRSPREPATLGPASARWSCATARTRTSAAAVYAGRAAPGVLGGFRQLQGKELSWNNLLDADAARKIVGALRRARGGHRQAQQPVRRRPRARNLVEAYRRALATDPVSAFGSIVALNRPADGALAEAMADLFVEVLIAPGFDERGPRRASPPRRTCGVLECPLYAARPRTRSSCGAIDGGFLAQPPDAFPDDPAGLDLPRRGGSRRPRSAAPWSSPGRSAATSSRTPSWSPTATRRWASAPAR